MDPACHVAQPAEQEAPVNPFKRRTRAYGRTVAVAALAAAAALSGCSAGQVAQTATQEAAINGTSGLAGPIALRNIHIYAVQTTDYIEPGTDVDLVFVAANTSPDVSDELVSITTDIGDVSLQGDTSVPVNGVLVVGTPTASPALWRASSPPTPPRPPWSCPSLSPTA